MEQQESAIPSAPGISSFMTRATNVFSSPSELFTEMASAPVQTTSWLLPLVFSVIVSISFVMSLNSNPELRQQMAEPGRQAIQEKVASGQMTRDQADQAEQFMGSSFFVYTAIGGAAVVTVIMLFGFPLLLWLLVGAILKTPTTYKKMLEVYGISAMISLLGTIVTLLMMYMMNSMRAIPSPSLFIMHSYDYHNIAHRFLSSLNIFTAWQVIVLGIGVSKFTQRTVGVGISATMGVWIFCLVLAALAGWGAR